MKASDNPFASLLIVEGGTPATPASGDQRLFVDVADHKVKRVNSSGSVTTVEGGSGSLTSSNALLGAPVTMTNANTYYDGPTLTLAAGTYILTAGLTVFAGVGANFTYKLWDGSTVLVSAERTVPSGGANDQCTLSFIVTPSGSTTYKMSVAASPAGCTIDAAAPNNGAGNNASWIYAVKIA